MDRQVLKFGDSFVRRFSSLIRISRISLMKLMLRLQLKAARYSLDLHRGIVKGVSGRG